jgi:CheY-like chemotaxis protein
VNTGGEPGKRRILVVDDEPLNRDLLRRVLIWDYHIEEAPDGRAALAVLQQEGPFDVIIADHAMPYLSGVELLARARTEAPATVGLLLTGYEDLPEVQAAQRQGAVFGVIGKPFDHDVLLEMVDRAMGEASRRRQASGAL